MRLGLGEGDTETDDEEMKEERKQSRKKKSSEKVEKIMKRQLNANALIDLQTTTTVGKKVIRSWIR